MYCDEDDVYDATGFNSDVIQKASDLSPDDVTDLIERFIARADQKIKRALGIPITIRKEYHEFDYSSTIELGPSEDEFEFFGKYEPEDCVEDVYAIYSSGRLKLPYPKDCDELTEAVTDMTGTNITLSAEVTDVKCGTKSIKMVVTVAGGYFVFPSGLNLNKNIYPWDHVGFWFKSSDKTATFTIYLYDKDGNYNYHTFNSTINNTWEIIALEYGNFTGTIDWSSAELQYIKIVSDKTGTAYFDNFNFNTGLFWTTPEGLICWCDADTNPCGEIQVTYSYDPFKNTIPDDLAEASAKFAGALLMDYLIGYRLRETGFVQLQDTLDTRPDRESMEIKRGQLQREAQACLAGIGYKTYSGIGTD